MNVLEILLSQTRFNEYLDNRTRLSLRSVSNGTYELTPILDTVTNVGALDCPTIRHLRKLRTLHTRSAINYEDKFPKLRDLRIEGDDFVTSIVHPELKTLIYENVKFDKRPVLERISCPRLKTLSVICSKSISIAIESNNELTDLRLERVNLDHDLKEFPNLRYLRMANCVIQEITNPLLEEITYEDPVYYSLNLRRATSSSLKRISCAGGRLRKLVLQRVDPSFVLDYGATTRNLVELQMINCYLKNINLLEMPNLKIFRLNAFEADEETMKTITHPRLKELYLRGELIGGLTRIACPELVLLQVVSSLDIIKIGEIHCPKLESFSSTTRVVCVTSVPSFPRLENTDYPTISFLPPRDVGDENEELNDCVDAEFDVERIKFVAPKLERCTIESVFDKFDPTSFYVDYTIYNLNERDWINLKNVSSANLISRKVPTVEHLYLRGPPGNVVHAYAERFPNVRSLTVYEYQAWYLDVSDFPNLRSLVIAWSDPLMIQWGRNYIELKYNSTLEKLVTINTHIGREDGPRPIPKKENYVDEKNVPDEYANNKLLILNLLR